jgi:putative phosphoesterase
MRIGVIADTHIPDRAKAIPQEILKAFKGVDMIIHAGDLVDVCILEELRQACPNLKAVYGNMDPYPLRKELAQKQIIRAGKYKIGLMHGWGPPAKLIELMEQSFKDTPVDIIIFGHAHSPFNEKKGNVLYFNPGSPTDKIFAPYNSYGIIEINDKIEARIVKI